MAIYEEAIKLKELYDAGVLTDEEFAKLKDRIINDKESLGDAPVIEATISPVIESYSNKECASCHDKIGFVNRFKLRDGAYVCKKCIKKAGFNTLTLSIADSMYISNELTLDTLFNDHSEYLSIKSIKKDRNSITCPKCKSSNVQFMQQGKKGFSVGKAVGGAVLTGGIGTLAGFAGKKGKKEWFCQNCNNVFVTR